LSRSLPVTRHSLHLGDSSEGVTPVPIPNTEVKPLSADGTARETWWESRSLPGLQTKASKVAPLRLFCLWQRHKAVLALLPFPVTQAQASVLKSISSFLPRRSFRTARSPSSDRHQKENQYETLLAFEEWLQSPQGEGAALATISQSDTTHDSSSSSSSRPRSRIRLLSSLMMASAKSRLDCWSCNTFSSTVSRAMMR
jgi:hypothetical protein